jgi:hypothetical protein
MLPLGQERRFVFGFARAMRIRMGEKARRPSIATSSVLHDYMEGNIVPLVRSVIDSSH